MKFKVLCSRGNELFLVQGEDGRYGLVNLMQGTVEWNKYMNHFLRFANMDDVTEQPGPEIMEQLQDVVDDRMVDASPEDLKLLDLDAIMAQIRDKQQKEDFR